MCVCVCLLFCCILCCLLFLGFLYCCSLFSFSTLILLVGSVYQITYTVLVETINTAQSINQSKSDLTSSWKQVSVSSSGVRNDEEKTSVSSWVAKPDQHTATQSTQHTVSPSVHLTVCNCKCCFVTFLWTISENRNILRVGILDVIKCQDIENWGAVSFIANM